MCALVYLLESRCWVEAAIPLGPTAARTFKSRQDPSLILRLILRSPCHLLPAEQLTWDWAPTLAQQKTDQRLYDYFKLLPRRTQRRDLCTLNNLRKSLQFPLAQTPIPHSWKLEGQSFLEFVFFRLKFCDLSGQNHTPQGQLQVPSGRVFPGGDPPSQLFRPSHT